MAERQEATAKVLLTVSEAAKRLGVGRTPMYELISTGQLRSVQIGRLRRVLPADQELYAQTLAAADAESGRPDAAA